ncbi:MAG: hypothetical protein HDR25_07585 [Lachnospiraceae bacterium]|nr:hypothetical protein [Lachnospiraceae bacterium]
MRKKNLLRKLAVAAAIACVLTLSACGSKNKVNDNQDPLTGEDLNNTQQTTENNDENGDNNGENNGDFSDFDAMLNDDNAAPNDIMDYINTNIVSAGVADVERFFSGLLSFGDDIRNIDFTKLNDSRQYMPEDMVAFMDLMKLEADSPSMVMSDQENRKVINMTLSEMLERAALFEQHIEKYPNHVTTDAAKKLYEEIATNAISGGYNSAEGIGHYYKGDTDNVVNQEALKYYQQFVDANKDSVLGQTVKEYIDVLQTNQFQINDTMETFYKGLHTKLDLTSRTNGTGTNVESQSDTKESGTGTNNNNDKNGNSNNATADAADTVIQGTAIR